MTKYSPTDPTNSWSDKLPSTVRPLVVQYSTSRITCNFEKLGQTCNFVEFESVNENILGV